MSSRNNNSLDPGMPENASGDLRDGLLLPLVEDFYTLQGEGAQTGRAAWFIRLGGCDVCCNWCDARESWNPLVHPPVEVSEMVERAAAHPAKAVVVTGGEPLLYPLGPLTDGLHAKGIEIFLETSGSHPFSGSFDWVCLSPKKHRPPLDEAWAMADELKVIIESATDLEWAEQCAEKVMMAGRLGALSSDLADATTTMPVTAAHDEAAQPLLFLQPEWSRREEMMPLLVDYIKQNPRWRMSLQSHKYMRIP